MSKNEIKCLLSLANSGDNKNLTEKLDDFLNKSESARVHDIVHQKSGDGLLHILARFGHTHCLETLLLKPRVFVDQRNLEDKTALHEAAQCGQKEALKLLLKSGAQVNSLKRADWTPLMLAVTKPDNLGCVELLVGGGADVQLVNKDGWTAFHLAVRTGDLSMVEYLLQGWPGCWDNVSKNGRTVLHTACLAGQEQVVRKLLQVMDMSRVNCQDSCGSTPVMDAVRGDYLDCVQHLLAVKDLNLGVVDRMGRSVVQVAAQAGALRSLELLRDECGSGCCSGWCFKIPGVVEGRVWFRLLLRLVL